MILHLTTGGSEPIELHIHDGATLSINPAVPNQKPQATNYMSGTRPIPRLVTHALVGVFGMAIGNTLLPRLTGGPSRVAGLAPPALPSLAPPALAALPVMPGSILQPNPRPDDALQLQAASLDVPAALTRQLAQQPTITPTPAQPRTGAGESAFGLEN